MRRFFLILLIVLWTVVLPPVPDPLYPDPATSEFRIGIGIAHQRGPQWAAVTLQMFDPPIWYNWIYDHLDDPTYVPMAYTMQPGYAAAYITAADQDQDRLWLVGNEPEAGLSYTHPISAAQFSQVWVAQTENPWACCGTQIFDPQYQPEYNWQAWLEQYLEAGGIVPDIWHVHIYGPHHPHQWWAEVERFRAWTQAQNIARPLIVSETAAAFPYAFDDRWDRRILESANLFLEKDPALLWVFWYSDQDYYGGWLMGDLRKEDEMTPLGEFYLQLREQKDLNFLSFPTILK